MDFEQKVASLPAEPGVYLFKDALEKIVYVGKATLAAVSACVPIFWITQ